MGEKRARAEKQGIAYLAVGAGTALFELAFFQLLYKLFHCPLGISNIIATVVATASNFLLNRSVTFKSTSNPLRSLVLYCLLFLANTAISTVAIEALVAKGVMSAIAKLVMQCCVVVWNFFLYRLVIFK